jgi:hypothetical protein
MMSLLIDNSSSCEFCVVIRFLHAAEIYHELCAAVYGQNIMREGNVRQWCRMFKDGRTNVHDEERSGRPAASCSELKLLTKKFVKDGASQFRNFYMNFHKFHQLFSTRLTQLR